MGDYVEPTQEQTVILHAQSGALAMALKETFNRYYDEVEEPLVHTYAPSIAATAIALLLGLCAEALTHSDDFIDKVSHGAKQNVLSERAMRASKLN